MQSFSEKRHRPTQDVSGGPAWRIPTASEVDRLTHPLLHLQRVIGNQAVARLLMNEGGQESQVGSSPSAIPGNVFGSIPVNAGTPARIQLKPAIDIPGDVHEEEANQVARQIMNASVPPDPQPMEGHRSVGGGKEEQAGHVAASGGRPLPADVRTFMESAFETDFSRVSVHTDDNAVRLNRALSAQAFTYNQDIYFGAGKHPAKDLLTAHELAHVLQQTGAVPSGRAPSSESKGMAPGAEKKAPLAGGGVDRSLRSVDSAQVPSIQRVIELRAPGKGEASAFNRRQELIDRLNVISKALTFKLDGNHIAYDLVPAGTLTNFDRQMQAFIDRTELVPLRLVTSAGLVSYGGAPYGPVLFDDFGSGYLDLEDLLASDDHAMQLVLVHLLTERFKVRNYARRIGTDITAEFDRAHQAGRDAETAFLQDLVGDTTIRYNYDEPKPDGTLVVAWKSAEGYRIFHVIHRGLVAATTGGVVWAQSKDGRRLTIEQLITERTAAAVP
jgi:uncharacterized protein DUF4157